MVVTLMAPAHVSCPLTYSRYEYSCIVYKVLPLHISHRIQATPQIIYSLARDKVVPLIYKSEFFGKSTQLRFGRRLKWMARAHVEVFDIFFSPIDSFDPIH